MPGTVLLLAASPVGKGCLVDAASVLPVLAAVAPAVLSGTETANVVELADPLEPQAVLTRLRAAATAPGPLTMFVTGQLQLDRRQRLPHLALARTTPATVRYTAFPWQWVTEELRLRPSGTTSVFVDLHADAETWALLSGRPLTAGPTTALYGRVAPPPPRRTLAQPSYMKAVATLLRSGHRPPLPQLHQQALTRTSGEEASRPGPADLVLAPGVAGPATVFPAPTAPAATVPGATALVAAPSTAPWGATIPAPAASPEAVPAPPARTAVTAPGTTVLATAGAPTADALVSAAPVSAAPVSAAPVPAAPVPGDGVPPFQPAAGQSWAGQPWPPAPEFTPVTSPPPYAPPAPGRPDRTAAPVTKAPASELPVTAPPMPTAPPERPAAARRSSAPLDPHETITAAVRAGRHGEALALAGAWETEAARAHGPGSEEVLHWMEVRADLAMLAGDPERSCRTWLAVAAARLDAGQTPDAPEVESAVDRAHHQWGKVGEPERARELGAELAALRLRVPGRREGALDHVRQQLRQLQTQA